MRQCLAQALDGEALRPHGGAQQVTVVEQDLPVPIKSRRLAIGHLDEVRLRPQPCRQVVRYARQDRRIAAFDPYPIEALGNPAPQLVDEELLLLVGALGRKAV